MKIMRKLQVDRRLPLMFRVGETTWRVFLKLLTSGTPLGPKDVSERLGLSSRSVGLYHLERLFEIGLVDRTSEGNYTVKANADLGFLEQYIFFERGVIPRVTLYAVFTTVLLLVYFVTVPTDFGAHNVYAITIGMTASVLFWFETIRAYRALMHGSDDTSQSGQSP